MSRFINPFTDVGFKPCECGNDFERWICVLKNMETLNRLPFAAQNAVFQKLASIIDVTSMSKHDREKYDESLRMFHDTLSVMQAERMEGRAEGARNDKIKSARKMKALGAQEDFICQVTVLGKEEFQKL